jgi:ParB family chromosome partitioning protein
MPDPIHLIPTAEIDESALPRDRTAHDQDALTELERSILAHGLRMPIEVYELAEPQGPHRYGLISGFRRLAAVHALHDNGAGNHATIPAFLRQPKNDAEVYLHMVEENAIRAEVSPWEQAMVAVKAVDAGAYPGIDAAVDALYASLGRLKRTRLRAVAHLAAELDGELAAPEPLSLRQLLRLAPLIPRGYGDLVRATLAALRDRNPAVQWQALAPILAEAEHPREADVPRPDRPRRLLQLPRQGLTIRRELARDGWRLHFSGHGATRDLLASVFDDIEHTFAP